MKMPEPGQADTTVLDPNAEEEPSVPRDWRAVIVACSGLFAIGVIGIVGVLTIPESVPEGEVSTKGENVVAIAAAAFTAVGTALAAYFGIKAANLAREDSTAAAERNEIRTAELAGAEPSQAGAANVRATEQIRALGLEARPSVQRGGRRTTRR
jgi:type IV secretory pathway VirB6-like protein